MCGRFAQFTVLETLAKRFPIDTVTCKVESNYNVTPSQEILSIIQKENNLLVRLNWGIVPFWVKEPSKAARPINARMETAAKKPSFKAAFKYRRCLILADGFYEWKKVGGRKQPCFFALAGKEPFAFAGLWETWHDADGSALNSCTILTTKANDSIRAVHHRMPVILMPDAYEKWLDQTLQNPGEVEILLQNNTAPALIGFPVSTYVNNPQHVGPKCIEPDGSVETRPDRQ
jgi:putative SOS response-associated peptidase YedK